MVFMAQNEKEGVLSFKSKVVKTQMELSEIKTFMQK